MQKAIQRGMCFTQFLIVRDQLSASMTRLGSGFMPPSVVSEAKHQLIKMQDLVLEMEQIAKTSEPPPLRMEKSCCGRD